MTNSFIPMEDKTPESQAFKHVCEVCLDAIKDHLKSVDLTINDITDFEMEESGQDYVFDISYRVIKKES